MSEVGFSAHWLDLREPADHAARDGRLLAAARACVKPGQVILDLGSGTGSTARAFARCGARAPWRFLDGDADLLELAGKRHPGSEQIVANLADVDALPLDGVGLVTASALFDLMPRNWIAALALRLRQARIPLYSALNYNGEMRWTPAQPFDAEITAAFNRHQSTDKGIGPATGPHATEVTKEIFEAQGYGVQTADSPWDLGPEDAALQADLNRGIATAAQEAGHPQAEAWLAATNRSHTRIGHTDLLAVLD
ncbi:MAG: class I SAM-dependent methyltransferase [Pseudomonadota bacterium]